MDAFELLAYMVEQEHLALDSLFDKMDDSKLSVKITENDKGEVTIGKRLAHLIGAEYRMATYLYTDENDDVDNFKVDPSSLDDIRSKSEQSKNRHLLTLQQLTDDDLAKTWTSKVSGNSYDYKYLLWHFIEHIATHRGQVATVLNTTL